MCKAGARNLIDPSAVIDPSARLADDVTVGPYSIIGADVEIGAGTKIGPHVVIKGPTRIGPDNTFFQFCSIGEDPQDLKYHGEASRLIIGRGNRFREFCTVHRGTESDHSETVIGNDNLFMAYVHIAHDCVIGDHVIFSNSASLAGHVRVEDHVVLSGFTLVHQFSRIGAHASTGMGSWVNRDVPPYVIAAGTYAHAVGINKEGLRRRGFSRESIMALNQGFKLLLMGRDRQAGMTAAEALADEFPEMQYFVDFIRASERGVVRKK